MAITKDEGRIGGKFFKRPLRRLCSTPYGRPPSAVHGISQPQPANEAGRSKWLSKLVDYASQIIVKGVSRLFSPVFGKGFASTPGWLDYASQIIVKGENINTIEEVAEMKSSPEVGEKHGNHIDITISIDYDGSDESKEELISYIDAFFQLKQLNKKESSWTKIDQLGELLYSKTIEIPEYQKKKKKVEINNNSNINPSLSHQIREEHFGNFFTFGCKRQINRKDCQKNCMAPKVLRKSEMYKMARSPYFGSSMMANTRKVFGGVTNRSAGLSTTNPIRAGHAVIFSPLKESRCMREELNLGWRVPNQARPPTHLSSVLKRGSSDRDEQCFDDARRVRQKSNLKDRDLTTHTDSKVLNHSDCKIPLASDLFAPPPRSMELAKKILYEMN